MKIEFTQIAGDGIGPEIMDSAEQVLDKIALKFNHVLHIHKAYAGGAAFDLYGQHLPEQTIEIAKRGQAILFGSVGGPVNEQHLPKWKWCEANSILALRKAFSFFANVRPVTLYDSLRELSPVKIPANSAVSMVVIRELLGDVYFGEHLITGEGKNRTASDSGSYTYQEIERIARFGFETARTRRKILHSVDKANVLSMSKLWREVVGEVAQEYPDVQWQPILVDNCAIQLVVAPQTFDVILCSNLFGDILSDLAAAIPGSLGLLPSASFSTQNKTFGLYEPSGGSAPDIAGKNIANPTAMILSAAMMLRSSFQLDKEAATIEAALQKTFTDGIWTADLLKSVGNSQRQAASLSEFTTAVVERI